MSIKFQPTLKPITEERQSSPSKEPLPMDAKRRAELDKEVAAMFKDFQVSWKDDQDRRKKMSELGKK